MGVPLVVSLQNYQTPQVDASGVARASWQDTAPGYPGETKDGWRNTGDDVHWAGIYFGKKHGTTMLKIMRPSQSCLKANHAVSYGPKYQL